jgi:hypothetical protein
VAIARAEDDVDDSVAGVCLAQPVREGHFRAIARSRQQVQDGATLSRPDEQIEVLGIPRDASVTVQRERPTDEERNMVFQQEVKHVPVEYKRRSVDCDQVAGIRRHGRLRATEERSCAKNMPVKARDLRVNQPSIP